MVVVAILGATLPVYLPIINERLHITGEAPADRIGAPENSDGIDTGNIVLTGTLAETEKDRHIWMIVKPQKSDGGFWPMKVTVNEKKEFACETILGGIDSYQISLVQTADDTNDYIANYLSSGKNGEGDYSCIFENELPSPYTVLDTIEVRRVK